MFPIHLAAADSKPKTIGGSAFVGLGAYSFWTGRQQLQANRAAILRSKSMFGIKSRQTAMVVISGGLVWMGVYRLLS